MGRFLIRRFLLAIPVLIGVTLLTFVLTNLIPGDPALWLAGEYATPEQVRATRERLGLDQPLPVQYLRYMARLVQGDLGISITSRAPVLDELLIYFPATVELTIAAMFLTLIIGIPLGVLTGATRSPWLNSSVMFVSYLGVGLPVFWAALVFQLIFFGQLHILPLSGRLGINFTPPPQITGMYTVDSLAAGQWATFGSAIHHLILPAVVLALSRIAIMARTTHASMVDVMRKEYIRTARAKGLSERLVTLRHGLKNGLLPIVTTLGLQIGWLLGGTILIENIFSWGGIGTYAWSGIFRLDIPVIMGITFLTTLVFVLVNLGTDIIYTFLDPRIHHN